MKKELVLHLILAIDVHWVILFAPDIGALMVQNSYESCWSVAEVYSLYMYGLTQELLSVKVLGLQ